MSQFKRGRRASVHTRRTMRLALRMHQALSALGTPPAKSDNYVSAVFSQLNAANQPSGGPWGMYLNGPDARASAIGAPPGGIGDCTAADSAHQVMLHSANGGQIVVPSDADTLTFYEATSGYVLGNESTDQGADETTVSRYLVSNGLAGVKSTTTAPIDPANIDHIKWAVQIFGAVRLGEIVDDAMEDQFTSLEPWVTAAAANDPSAGGHDTPGMLYDEDYLYVVTWAGGRWPQGLQPIAWSLLAQPVFLQEVHVDVFADFVRVGGTAPNGLDLDAMLADLQQIEAEEAA